MSYGDLQVDGLTIGPPLPDHLQVHLLADLYDNPELLAPPVAVIPNVAYRKRVTLLAAPRKLGKSTFMGDAVARLSRGDAFLKEPLEAGMTLWVAADEPMGDLVRRFQATQASGAGVFVVEPPVTVAEAAQAARSLGPALLVIDTISDLTARELENENDALAVKRCLEPLRQVARDLDVAIVLLHHTTKATGRSRGSGVFEDMADLILHMAPSSDDATVREINAEGRVAVDDFEVRWGEDGFELADGEQSLIQRVRMAVWARPGCSKRDLRDAVTGRSAEIAVAINRLMAAGEVENRGSKSHFELHVVENTGNHLGNHSSNLPGTAREPAGTTREPVPVPVTGSPPIGGTSTAGTTGTPTRKAA